MNKIAICYFCVALWGCSNFDSSKVKNSIKLQSLLIQCAAGPKNFFSVDTSLEGLISSSIVKAVDSFETITVFDIINFSGHERMGIVQINDASKFFQYSRNSDTSDFVFRKGTDGFLTLERLSKFLSKNFDRNIDNIVHKLVRI